MAETAAETAKQQRPGSGPSRDFLASLPGGYWPAVPGEESARVRALLELLEQSQWALPEQMLTWQFRQLRELVRVAGRRVPLYRERFAAAGVDADAPLDEASWRAIPLVVKEDLRARADTMKNPALGQLHGPLGQVRSSGSTGTPVTVITTEVTRTFWNAFTMREHYWHERDFSQTLAAIRFFRRDKDSTGVERRQDDWGRPLTGLVRTGPAITLSVMTPVHRQLEWLARSRPGLLVTYPSNAFELARQSLETGLQLPTLREVMLLGETVTPEVRQMCREAWNVPVTDVYTSNEIGYMALQCPSGDHYHVQSEGVFLEVLDEKGLPCAPGQVGKVVVTSLHNFAMPLIRYAIGDYAEAGPPCGCGRQLPVLSRILGRTRNMLVLPSGERYWPQISGTALKKIAPAVIQAQFIQRTLEEVEVRMVLEGPLTEGERKKMEAKIRDRLKYPFNIVFTPVEKIEHSPEGKFEEFKSLVAE